MIPIVAEKEAENGINWPKLFDLLETKNPTLTLKRVPIDENLDLLESSDVGGNKLATKEQLEEFNNAWCSAIT